MRSHNDDGVSVAFFRHYLYDQTRLAARMGDVRPGGFRSGISCSADKPKHWGSNMQAITLRTIFAILLLLAPGFAAPAAQAAESDLEVAMGLATMLRAARTVIAGNQSRINDASLGDKGLSGEAVLQQAVGNYRKATGDDPRKVDPQSRFGRLLQAQMQAIVEVMTENQTQINQQGVGFKGFVPAVFARLVNERFRDLMGQQALVKVTAPPDLVRNRKARPDRWEAKIIADHLLSPDWSTGKIFSAEAERKGRPAYRVLVPEYYGKGCLNCHGEPAGKIDVTGYPMEGGKLGELGGVISVTLFR